jgi:prepilin-type processing-associated H-X9-DG protein
VNGFWLATVNGKMVGSYVIKTYICPSDPVTPSGTVTLDGNVWQGLGLQVWGVTNYPCNIGVFGLYAANPFAPAHAWYANATPGFNIGNIPDGTSNTVAFAERYGQVLGQPLNATYGDTHGSLWAWPQISSATNTAGFNYEGTQADVGHGWDYTYYVTHSNNFIQNQPTLANSQWSYNQAFHTGIMNVAFMDGSVQTISSSIAPATWGILVDPKDGQVVPAY